ncbi:uncharacterized protein LOC144006958 isoform X3 [Festucalex cinctus]
MDRRGTLLKSPGKDNSSSDDDLPLSDLVMRRATKDKQSTEDAHSSNAEDKSDDEPLIKMKTKKKENRSSPFHGKKSKNAADDSSDNGPLMKAKAPTKAVKKFTPPKKSAQTKKKKDVRDEDASSDDEPLSVTAKKLRPQQKENVPASTSAQATGTPSKRNAAKKRVKFTESCNESSDDNQLAGTVRKKAIANRQQTPPAKYSKKTRAKRASRAQQDDGSENDGNDDDDDEDDDVPLVNLIAKKTKPAQGKKKAGKKSVASQGSASKKRRAGQSDESSGDEPLVNLVKKSQTEKKSKLKKQPSAPKKRVAAPKGGKKKATPDVSSEDEPLMATIKHPQVTKTLRIKLERCEIKEAAAATASQAEWRLTKKPSEKLEESSE